MKIEKHIEYDELARGDEYDGNFGETYCPGQSCAIYVYNQKEDERKWCQPWELMMFEDLEALGIMPGDGVWVEVDY